MHLYGIVGAGGFGREVMPVARAMLSVSHPAQDYELVFVVETGDTGVVNGHRIVSLEFFIKASGFESKKFNIAIADSKARQRIAEILSDHEIDAFDVVALQSIYLDGNQTGRGLIQCPYSMITSNVKIGKFFHANFYSYVTHDCVIGDYVTFAPGVHCNGRVVIEDHAYIGSGAIIRQGSSDRPITIGRGAIIGMGAVVTKSVEPFVTMVGNPAKILIR